MECSLCAVCLTATCDKWENGKSIRSIDSGHASIEHGAKTDTDLARPPGGDHPATQQASPSVLTQGAARRGRRVPVTRNEAGRGPRMRTRGSMRSGPAEDRSRRTGRGSGPTMTSSQSTGGALTDTQRASRHCMCDLHMHNLKYRYDRAEVVLTLFRSIRFQSYAVESQIQPANKRIGNGSCGIQL
jgi:hypothetical protein